MGAAIVRGYVSARQGGMGGGGEREGHAEKKIPQVRHTHNPMFTRKQNAAIGADWNECRQPTAAAAATTDTAVATRLRLSRRGRQVLLGQERYASPRAAQPKHAALEVDDAQVAFQHVQAEEEVYVACLRVQKNVRMQR